MRLGLKFIIFFNSISWLYAYKDPENIDSIDKLLVALNSSNKVVVAYYANANYVSTKSLFNGIQINYTTTGNELAIIEGVRNGSFLAGSVVQLNKNYTNEFNVIKTNIISAKATFTLPDFSEEYPHGASRENSRKDFRNALNLAIIKLQNKGIDFELAKLYNEKLVDIRSCKVNNYDEFPIPNRSQASGILAEILRTKTVLVGSYGNPNNPDESEQEFKFNVAYLDALIKEFSQLSGKDNVLYGDIQIQRIYAQSSTANLLRGRVHMTEPYFLIDNVYSGSKENCKNDTDCIRSNTPSGYESCTNNICVSYQRPVNEMFKLSCLTYGTESLFITKRYPTSDSDGSSGSVGSTIAIILLSLLLIFVSLFLVYVVFRERTGYPLFRS
jgi:hypothetical protein